MKDVLLNKLNRSKGSILILLFTICTCLGALAQSRQITGKVTSSDDGSPMPGVSVKVKGTATGTTTDVNGVYKINAANGTVLAFSFIGYASQEITIGAGSTYNVKLAPDAKTLVEVNVVATGYGSSKRRDLTGSISSVSAAQIAQNPVTNATDALQGRAPGVNVTSNDGAPGGSPQVAIRGVGSLGGTQPLYVIDGYPTTGIDQLNPNDIATFDILKDASATAIYGDRASNGVIMITTKRGRRDGGLEVSLNALDAIQSKPKEYKVLDAQTWGALANAHATIDGYSPLAEWADPSKLTEADWQNALYRTGLRQQYDLAIRGGNEKMQTSMSAAWVDQSGIVLGSDYKRINLATNLDYTPLKWLRSSTSVKYSRTDSKVALGTGGEGAGLGIGYLSKLPPTITGNKLTDQIKDANGNYGFYTPTNTYVAGWGNGPLYTVETQDQSNLGNYFIGSTSLEATIFDGLKIKTYYGVNYSENSGYYFTPSDTRAQTQYGQGTQTSQNNLSRYDNNNYEYTWDNTLSYDKTFGQHSIDVVVGTEQQDALYRNLSAGGTNLFSDQLRALEDLPSLNSWSGYQTPTSLSSFFGRFNYKFMDKYLITGTVRRDGSSKFAPGHQFGTFPSGSIAWRIKQEDFLKNVNWLTDLKLRGSYGEVGNQLTIPPFQYLAQYTPGPAATTSGNNGYPFGKTNTTPGVYQPGLVLSAPPNPDLKWETSDITDIGMDAAFLNGALTLTVDYYNKKSRDFLLQIPIPPQTGFTNKSANVGSIQNKGFEFTVDYAKTVNDFHYDVNLNVATLSNKLLSLASGEPYITNIGLQNDLGFSGTGTNNWVTYSETKVGQALGQFYGYKADGIFQSQPEIDALNANSVAKNGPGNLYQTTGGPTGSAVPGDRKFKDLNGDGRITAADQTSLGSPIPKITGGLNLTAGYKAWDINLFLYGVAGNKIFNYQERTLESFESTTGGVGIENISQQYYDNAWTQENHSNRYAVISANDFNVNTRPSDVYVENGSYLRLKTATLGYTVPKELTQKISITKLRIFFTAQNLFTITGYSGLDPEIGIPANTTGGRNISASGVDVGTYPGSKFYTFGLNVTL